MTYGTGAPKSHHIRSAPDPALCLIAVRRLLRALSWLRASETVPLGVIDLHRVMEHVAAEQRLARLCDFELDRGSGGWPGACVDPEPRPRTPPPPSDHLDLGHLDDWAAPNRGTSRRWPDPSADPCRAPGRNRSLSWLQTYFAFLKVGTQRAVLELRVPVHVIDMQMGAHHHVDLVRRLRPPLSGDRGTACSSCPISAVCLR